MKKLNSREFNTAVKVFIIFTLVYFAYGVARSETIKVAVIDTGFDVNSTWTNASKVGLSKPKLCTKGHYDFVNNDTTIEDNHGHGTHIAGLIAKDNSNKDYCLVIYKYYDPNKSSDNMKNSLRALKAAIDANVNIINYSGGGNDRSYEECQLVKQALDKGISIVAAAGNEGSDLSKKPYYPAICDDRIIKVMNLDKSGAIASSSNYDSTKIIVNINKTVGTNLLSLMPNNTYGYLTGTSQATAIITGTLLKGE